MTFVKENLTFFYHSSKNKFQPVKFTNNFENLKSVHFSINKYLFMKLNCKHKKFSTNLIYSQWLKQKKIIY